LTSLRFLLFPRGVKAIVELVVLELKGIGKEGLFRSVSKVDDLVGVTRVSRLT
jgi:hypothetical protein